CGQTGSETREILPDASARSFARLGAVAVGDHGELVGVLQVGQRDAAVREVLGGVKGGAVEGDADALGRDQVDERGLALGAREAHGGGGAERLIPGGEVQVYFI